MATFNLQFLANENSSLHKYKKFRKVRECGSGNLGFALSFTVCYLEHMILSQRTCFSNYQFIDKVIDKYLGDAKLPLITRIIEAIRSKIAEHDTFSKQLISENPLKLEIETLARRIFNGADFDSQSEDLIRKYTEMASKELNVQVIVYDDNDVIFKVRNNTFSNALVLSIYQNVEADGYKYFILYHANYKTLSIENFNVTDECTEEDYSMDELNLFNDTMLVLMETFKISAPKKHYAEAIRDQFYVLKRKCKKTWPFERKLCNGCKGYLVGFENCGLCKKIMHKFKFGCGCKYCPECLFMMNSLDECPMCRVKLDSKDTRLLTWIKEN